MEHAGESGGAAVGVEVESYDDLAAAASGQFFW